MSEQVVEPQGQLQGDNNTPPVTEQQPESQNPAWAPILEDLPESLHSLITPKLKEWDAGVTKKFQETAEKYKPWEDVITQGDPETVNQALQLMQALESDPASVYKLIADTYGYAQQAAPATPPQTVAPTAPVAPVIPGVPNFTPDPDDPQSQMILYLQQQLQQQNENQNKLVQYLASQQEQQQLIQRQQTLDAYLKQLHEANPDFPFDDGYVITKMGHGVKAEDAVKELRAIAENVAKTLNAPNNSAPVVSGSEGGVPSTQQDLTSMSTKDTNKLVAELLRANAEQNNAP